MVEVGLVYTKATFVICSEPVGIDNQVNVETTASPQRQQHVSNVVLDYGLSTAMCSSHFNDDEIPDVLSVV